MAHQAQLHSKIALLLLLLISCTQDPMKLYLNVADKCIKPKRGVFYFEGKPFSGTYYELNKADTLWTEQYLNGKEHGVWKKWHSAKKIASTRHYQNGEKVGLYEAWWPSGAKQFVYAFKNDLYDGFQKEWNQEGMLIRQMNYQDGQEFGTQKVWYNSGKIKANYLVKNGRRYGLLGTKNCINVTDSIF